MQERDVDMGFSPADRTLLIRIQVEVEHLVQDMKNYGVKLQRLEDDHVSRHELEEVVRDIGVIQKWYWKMLGGSTVVGVLVYYIAKVYFHA